MITWVTVWVLTVVHVNSNRATSYQLEYKTQQTCIAESKKHMSKANRFGKVICSPKQIPMVVPK